MSADPELCSLEGGKKVDPGCPGPHLPSGTQSRPYSSIREGLEAKKAQPVGCPQEPGRGLRVNGYVGRS